MRQPQNIRISPNAPLNKGKLIGQRPPLKKQEIWSIRIHLQLAKKVRDLALFNLAIDSKLRGCDLVSIRVRDILLGEAISTLAKIMQQKTHQPVQFEITEQTREAVTEWISRSDQKMEDYLFSESHPSR